MVSPSVNNGRTGDLLGGTMVGLMGGTVPCMFYLVLFLWVQGDFLTTLGAVGLVDVGIVSATLGSVDVFSGWATLCGAACWVPPKVSLSRYLECPTGIYVSFLHLGLNSLQGHGKFISNEFSMFL